MSELDIIRAWKDKTYRNSLSAEELAQLPEHPAGAIDLTDDELANVDGVTTPTITASIATIVSAVSASITLISYLSYRAGTNGTANTCCTVASSCPCPPPPV